jgi:hypothetical protein
MESLWEPAIGKEMNKLDDIGTGEEVLLKTLLVPRRCNCHCNHLSFDIASEEQERF